MFRIKEKELDYAIAHAVKGVTFVAKGIVESQPEIIRLREDPVTPTTPDKKKRAAKPKIAFVSGFQPGDRVFVELGGAADRLALAALAFGAEVWRYPSFRLGKEQTREIVEDHGWTIDDERPSGAETGEELTVRKTRALALYSLAGTRLDQFVKAEGRDLSLLRLALHFRAYRRSQKATLRAYQGLLSAYRDQAFVDLASNRQEAARVSDEDIHSYVLERLAEDILGGEISATEKMDFFAAIGKEFEGGRLPERATEETIEKIVEAMLESDRFRSTVFDRLKSQRHGIELLLKGGREKKRLGEKRGQVVPANEIWEKVFEAIPGCGPLIAARLISAIGDIRRFEDFPALKAFAGYHHFADGSRARRVAGKVSNWHPELKQGIYLLCEQTVKMPDSPWRARLDQRKSYELWKILRDRQQKADDEGLSYEILPASLRNRVIRDVNDFTPLEYAIYQPTGRKDKKGKDIKKLVGGFAFHVDELRKQAGVTSDAEEEAEDSEEQEEATVKDPVLAKLVRGVKMQAHQKAMRWLGQQFLKHVFKSWRLALGLSEFPVKTPPTRPRGTRPTEVSASV